MQSYLKFLYIFFLVFFLDLVMRSTRSSPEVLGYCLDQLSFMIFRCDSLDPLFLQHFVDRMEDSFMASFLPDDDSNIPSTSRGNLELRFTNQYGLDKDSEEPISLGVGILVLKVLYLNIDQFSLPFTYSRFYYSLPFLSSRMLATLKTAVTDRPLMAPIHCWF